MDNSLSIILPVFNVERSLAAEVARLLDLLPDLTHRFEVLIVDDASTDHTCDAADELARIYPQVRVVRHVSRLGLAGTVQTGMKQAMGDVVLVQEEDAPLSARELRRLWKLRSERATANAAFATQPRPIDQGTLDRLAAWGQSLHGAASEPATNSNLPETRRPPQEEFVPQEWEPDFGIAAGHDSDLNRADIPHGGRKAVPMRSFLKQLRDLAIGD